MVDQLTTSTHQLSRLLSQGMITHILTPPGDGLEWSIDPHTIREIKDLKLMVILDDGTVAISCPEGLPTIMRDAAIEIERPSPGFPQEEPIFRRSSRQAEEKVDELIAALGRLDGFLKRIESIEQVATKALKPAEQHPDTSIILSRFDYFSELVKSIPSTFASKLAQLEATERLVAERLSVLSDSLEYRRNDTSAEPNITEFQNALTVMAQQIARSISDAVKPQELIASLDEINSKFSVLDQSTENRFRTLSNAVDRLSDEVTSAPSLEYFTNAVLSIRGDIKRATLESVTIENLTELLDQVYSNSISADIVSLLEGIHHKTEELFQKSPVRFEMTPVHQAISRQTAALVGAIRRVEQFIADGQTSAASLLNDTISAKLDELLDASAEQASQDNRSIERLTALEHRIDMLNNPVPETSEQVSMVAKEVISFRQQLARHATAHTTVLRRLEDAIDRIPSLNISASLDTPLDPSGGRLGNELGLVNANFPLTQSQKKSLSVIGHTNEESIKKIPEKVTEQVGVLSRDMRRDLAEELAKRLKLASEAS